MCSFVGGLSCFHFYLTSINCTTYEHFRHKHSGRSALKNPYNRGFLRNWGQVFLRRTPTRLPEPLLTGEPAPILAGSGLPGEMSLLQDTQGVHGGCRCAAAWLPPSIGTVS